LCLWLRRISFDSGLLFEFVLALVLALVDTTFFFVKIWKTVHLSGPHCKIRTAQRTNQNVPFRPGSLCHIINQQVILYCLLFL